MSGFRIPTVSECLFFTDRIKQGSRFDLILFKPSVTQPISQTTYELNSKLLLVHYSSHVLNNKLLVCYSSHDLNNEPFKEQTIFDHLNPEPVGYSDPLTTAIFVRFRSRFQPALAFP